MPLCCRRYALRLPSTKLAGSIFENFHRLLGQKHSDGIALALHGQIVPTSHGVCGVREFSAVLSASRGTSLANYWPSNPNAATPFGVPTYTLPLAMVGTINLLPAPKSSRPPAASFVLYSSCARLLAE
jgi:hypothetical protein